MPGAVEQARGVALDQVGRDEEQVVARHRRKAAHQRADVRLVRVALTTQQLDEADELADRIAVLNAGRIEQVGGPMELYNDPANVFVAGFIGSPRMNFLEAAPLGAAGKLVGIRPEHLAISRETGAIAGTISHVEHLGSETNIYVRTEPHGLLTARIFGEHRYGVDEIVHLTPDASRQFHFDADGQRLRAAA